MRKSSCDQASHLILVLTLFLLLSCAPTSSDAALACSDVIKYVKPCVNYLVKGSGLPPADCCSGASNLATAVANSADKKTACDCLKSAAKKMNPQEALAKALPSNCGITLPFTISADIDCTKIG
ncbi:Bifunctional inhibitor/plant lipid transfer protein/seed storage helical domain [Dillenia turbinata]|uniref:Non-specific lipid-transfer protein n=1 Tax=Dillenia turbinata TaxID=194707 RepID=A0AAN8VMJ6_9MAGN